MALKVVGNTITLSSGFKMPLLGLGCGQIGSGLVGKAVEIALDNGYRHIDTAYLYQNEVDIGIGIQNWLKKSGNKREEVFVVTKLPPIGMNPESVEKFLRLSLKKLKLEYVDLYLIHFPIGLQGKNEEDFFPLGRDGKLALDYGTNHIAIWKEMEKMVELGLTKSIGISNFSIKQTRRLIAISKIPPAVNQVEMHVYFQQKELHEFSRQNNIVLTAYAAFGSPSRRSLKQEKYASMDSAMTVLKNPVVKLIADKHHVTPAQVLIRYWIEKEVVVIPNTYNEERIKINGDVFSFALDETDMAALLLLDKGKEGESFIYRKIFGGEEHPEF